MMIRFIISAIVCCFMQSVVALDLKGAGGTFSYPLYAKWTKAYQKQAKVNISYQSLDSKEGIKQLAAKQIDFAATDFPLSKKKLEKAQFIQFPVAIGGIVVAFNLKALSGRTLKLSPEALTEIFLGKITSWRDRKIQQLNPKLNLPNKDIVVVHREDSSGTTFLFTTYLALVSDSFAKNIGTGQLVRWPVGIGGKGNEGVSEYIKNIDGAIGYVEFNYAKVKRLSMLELKNKSGSFVSPSNESFSHAAKASKWSDSDTSNTTFLNQRGEKSWPILGVSYALLNKKQDNPKLAKVLLDFFEWTNKYDGQKITQDLNYIPLPKAMIKQIKSTFRQLDKAMGKKT